VGAGYYSSFMGQLYLLNYSSIDTSVITNSLSEEADGGGAPVGFTGKIKDQKKITFKADVFF